MYMDLGQWEEGRGKRGVGNKGLALVWENRKCKERIMEGNPVSLSYYSSVTKSIS